MTKREDMPLPDDTIKRFVNDVFLPVKNNLCVSCHFIPGTGKRTLIKFLVSDQTHLKALFGEKYSKTLFIYVDPDEILEESNEAYLRLMYDNLLVSARKHKVKILESPSANPFIRLRENLQFLTERNWHCVFLLLDFEFTLDLSPSIHRNLESILALNKSLITYIFLSSVNLLDEAISSRLHNLKYAVNRVVRYKKPLNDDEADYMILQILKSLRMGIGEFLPQVIKKCCGHHPQLIKYALYNISANGLDKINSISKLSDFVLSDQQLQTICTDIWNILQPREQKILLDVSKWGTVENNHPENFLFLIKTGLIVQDHKEKYRVFSEVFQVYIQNKLPADALSYDILSKQIKYGNKNFSDAFSLQEFKLLSHFIDHLDVVITRDEIGQVLWGKDYFDKYSDWMIDKIISTLRKKLSTLGFPTEKLITLKKRGFTLTP